MEIDRTSGISGAGGVEGKKTPRVTKTEATAPAPQSDKVEISQAGQFISQVASLPAVRQDKVAEVKNLIEQGKYDTPQRLSGAIDKFLQENSDLLK